MVEKFEERVEDRLEEMEAKLAATEGILQASEQADSEKITKVGKQVSSSSYTSCCQLFMCGAL